MRFIVDAQLPPTLTRILEDAGHSADHVFDLGLGSASDLRIWQMAAQQNAVIITKDEDFIRLRSVRGAGPAIVWVRVGNTTRQTLLGLFKNSLPKIIAAIEAGEMVVELHDR